MKYLLKPILITSLLFINSFSNEEGGYAGTRDEGHTTVVYNFLKQFSEYEQYYYSTGSQFIENNDNRVDAMDFAIFAGHGNAFFIRAEDGAGINFGSVGNTSHEGYGDDDLEFLALETCKSVPSPLEGTWSTPWVQSGGAFDGLHQVVGFRTDSWQSSDQNISLSFGKKIVACRGVYSAWFDAINEEGLRTDPFWWWEDEVLREFGSAVMHPDNVNDTYCSMAPDPSKTSGALTVWYQH